MKKTAIIALLFFSGIAMAQKVKVEKGDFKFLKGQKEVNIEFVYSNLKLMKEEITEEQYVKERAAELNEKSKGKGDIWKKKWEGSKELIWNLKFLELANIVLSKEKKDLVFQEGATNAKYTLIVDAVWIYPGWDAAVMKQAAKVSTVLRFVETANRNNVVLELSTDKAPGDQWGNNFSNESRIGEGFAKTAKTMSKMILKEVF
ncbi:hypothetical protein J2X31_000097 [Flavobacterium arsenatis]|uniref:DUF4468 domain-containing protein n=1 Tax=Flavobacterium arsenatis TaxID=1484332 RepID=A0ABU1TJD7_9FLAO|nr:hypothetical protein [Flavobacterium arsenatis]MDR6966104.1 hypothetical protein [Flavobacterium arsenatis]